MKDKVEDKNIKRASLESTRDITKCIDCIIAWSKDGKALPNCASCDQFIIEVR